MQSQEQFIHFHKFFGSAKPEYQLFAPYRVCPIGAHSDHQHGLITGLAFDMGISIIASSTPNDRIQLLSMSFEGIVSFKISEIIGNAQNNWGDYIRGAVKYLKRDFQLLRGMKGVITGMLPVGGLSSSAALLTGFIKILAKINQIQLSDMDIINYSSLAEREYVGLRNGILDQSCVVLSKKDRLLYLDTKTKEYQFIKFGGDLEKQSITENKDLQSQELPFEIGIYFSGVTRKLTDTNFNQRVTECKVAAWMLNSYQGQKLCELEDARLRSYSQQIFNMHKDKMPESFRKRATHFYSEFDRVKQGVQFWKKGDIKSFGRLMFESCESSIVNYECASPQLITIYEIMKDTDGVYGGRFSGAGFKGACVSLIDPTKKKEIQQKMTRQYLKKFPQYKDSFKVHFCKSDNGVKFTSNKQVS